MDLNAAYYGNFKFQMHYKKASGPVFNWLYVDYDNLHKAASACGFTSKRIEVEEHHYLAQLCIP
jgi:hypothetical protein